MRSFAIVVLFVASLISGFSNAATTRTWDGGALTTSWHDAANWTDDTVPTATDDVVIATNVTVQISSTAVCLSLALTGTQSGSSGFNAQLSVNVGGTLTVSGSTNLEVGDANQEGKRLFVNGGAFETDSLTLNCGNTNTRRTFLEIGTGAARINGTLTFDSGDNHDGLIFSGNGTLQLGGNVIGTPNYVVESVSDIATGKLTRGTIEYFGTNQSISALTYYNLKLTGTGTTTVPGTPLVLGTLDLNETSATLLIAGSIDLGASATLLETGNERTIGEIKTTRSVPMNNSSTFGGLGISITDKSGAGIPAVTVRRFSNTVPANISDPISRYWSIDNGAMPVDATVSFGFYGSEYGGDTGELVAYKSVDSGASWVPVATQIRGNPSVVDVTGFSFWTFAPAVGATLNLSGPVNATAGVPFSVTVTAKNAEGQVDTTYSNIVSFSSSDVNGSVVLPVNSTLTDGIFTGDVTLVTAAAGASVFVSDGTLADSINVNVSKANSTTSLALTGDSPSVFGQSLTFTATVAPSALNTLTPTGTVKFFNGLTEIGTGTLSTSMSVTTATFSTSSLAVSTGHEITAQYQGDGSFNTSASNLVTHAVNKAATETTLTSSATTTVFGETVTFTATVSATAAGAAAPTGTVNFRNDSTVIGSGALSTTLGVTTATFSTSALAVHAGHNITAEYQENDSFLGSSSGTVSQTVSKADSETILIRSTGTSPSDFQDALQFTATVSATAPGSGTPSGTVQLLVDGVNVGSATNLVDGSAVLSIAAKSLPVGVHSITAVYAASNDFESSTSDAVSQNVTPGDASKFVITPATGNAIAGELFQITIQAQDGDGNLATEYEGEKLLSFRGASAAPNPTDANSDDLPQARDRNGNFVEFDTIASTALNFNSGSATTDIRLVAVELAHIKATQGAIDTLDADDLDVSVTPASPAKFKVSGAATLVAGTSTIISVTALDAFGNIASSYTDVAAKMLTFSGASPSTRPVTHPSTRVGGAPVDFLTSTPIVFTGGESVPIELNLYHVETAQITASDGTLATLAADTLTVAVSHNQLEKFKLSLAPAQRNSIPFAGTNTLVAQDGWGNAVLDFNTSAVTVTTSIATGPSTESTVGLSNNVYEASSFDENGVLNLTDALLLYTGVIGTKTFRAISSSGKSSKFETEPEPQVIFDVGNVDASKSTFAVTPDGTVTADGVDSATIEVTVRDVSENVISGKTVSLVQGTASSAITIVNDTTDANGVATFTVSSTKAESVAYKATADVLIALHAHVTFEPGAPKKIMLSGNGSQVAGASQTVTVNLFDAFDNPTDNFDESVTLKFFGANPSPNMTVPTVNGQTVGADALDPSGANLAIPFNDGVGIVNLELFKSETAAIQARDADDALTLSDSNVLSVDVSAASLTNLVLTLAASQSNDAVFTGTNKVVALDTYANPRSGHNPAPSSITITVDDAGAVLSGNVITAAFNAAGEFALTNFKYRGLKGTKIFTASSGSGVTGQATVEIQHGVLDHFAVSTIASPQTAGEAITVSSIVAQDISGNTVESFTGQVAIASEQPAGDVLGVAPVMSASFAGGELLNQIVRLKNARANAKITVTSGTSSGTSNTFTVDPNSATTLAFTTEPFGATAGSHFTTQPVVKSFDDYQNLSTKDLPTTLMLGLSIDTGGFFGTPSLSIDMGTGGAMPGVAEFSGLRIDAAGSYTLTASAGVAFNEPTATLTVNPAAASVLVVKSVNNGVSPTADTPFAVVVESQDAFQNPSNVTENHAIQLSKSSGSVALSGTTTGILPANSSTVTVSGVAYTKAETGVRIAASDVSAGLVSDADLTDGTSALFTVVSGAVSAAQSTVVASKLTVTADGVDSATVTVALKDAFQNAVAGKTVSLSGAGSSTITTVIGTTDAAGLATFTVTSAQAGSVTYTATVVTDAVTVTQTATVTFTAVSLTPAVTSVSPNFGPTQGGTTVSVLGTGFQTGAVVTFDGVAANTTVVSLTEIRAISPAHASGKVVVTVTNINTLSGTLNSGFDYNDSPSFSSGVTVSPAVAVAGQVVTATVPSSDPEGNPLTTAYTWGDGSGGGTNTHVYSLPGNFTLTVEISDGVNAAVSSTLTVTVIAAALPGGETDTDADGFSDAEELAAGTNPQNAESKPAENGANPLTMTVSKLQITLNFARAQKDSITVAGSVPAPNGFAFTDELVVVNVGGIAKSFSLSSSGRMKAGADSISLAKPKNGLSKFSVTFAKGSFADELTDENLIDATTGGTATEVKVNVIFNGKIYQEFRPLTYKAKKGKTGSAK